MQQGSNGTSMLTDEQILDMEPLAVPRAAATEPEAFEPETLAENPRLVRQSQEERNNAADDAALLSSAATDDPARAAAQPAVAQAGDPAWLKSLEAQPQGGREAAAEARAWRAAATDVASLDAAYFSADAGTRSGLAARLCDNDPAAFRAMLAESARMLSLRDPQGLAELARELGAANRSSANQASVSLIAAGPRTLLDAINNFSSPLSVGNSSSPLSVGDPNSPLTVGNTNPPLTASSASTAPSPSAPLNAAMSAANPNSPQNTPNSTNPGAFPVEAYRSFEAATNEDVARRVHRAIDHTLSTTLPEGMAEGARRRIAEDIFQEVHASLAADRDLGRRLGETLRDWRFDAAARQQVSSLLTGRARAVLPEVARRVVAEWTNSVLASDRAKTARIDAASSRRDITGGRLPEPVPASSLRPRDIDYRRLSDEQIMEL